MAALAGRFVFNHYWERLGFARLADYGTERLGLSARLLYDLAHTDRVLAELPEIDRAFVRGELPWTKVRLLARAANADDQGSWIARARRMTSAALAKEVRAADVGAVESGGAGRADEDDGEEPWENVKIRCRSPVPGKWHRARQLAYRMAGRPVKPWECGEMVAAEVLSAIEIYPEAEDAVTKAGQVGRPEQATQEVRPARQELGQLFEVPTGSANGHPASASPTTGHEAMPSASPVSPKPPANSDNNRTGSLPPVAAQTKSRRALGPMRSKWTTPELPPHLQSLLTNLDRADAFDLDARLRETVALEQRLDAEIGAILALVAHEQRYLCHGFRNMEDYARERLGMAAGKARTLLRLERASGVCPALTEAYRDGRLSWVQAGTLAPVVLIPHGDLPNREAWVEWATQVSVRRLKEDVEWALLLNKTEPERFATTGGLPAGAGYGGYEADASGAAGRPTDEGIPVGGTSAGDTTAGDAAAGGMTAGGIAANGTTGATDSPTCSDRQIGAQPRVSQEDTLLFFHAPRSVARLFRAVRCTVPGCSSLTNLHDHHIVFRSAGGSNDLGNRTTLCVWHHLRGVHGGTVRCLGRAPHVLRFELGLRRGGRPLLGFEPGEQLTPAQRPAVARATREAPERP